MEKRRIDRRVMRTRAMLHDALLSLLGEKSYDAITVEDICHSANVGRSTFYAHYTGKDDLMRSGFRPLRESLLGRHRNVETPRDMKDRRFTFSLTMLEHARGHMHLHRTLVGNRGGTIAFGAVRQLLCDLVSRELAPPAGRNAKDTMPREFVVQYVVGAYMAVLTWWLDNGAQLAPQQVDAMFQRLVSEGIGPGRRRPP